MSTPQVFEAVGWIGPVRYVDEAGEPCDADPIDGGPTGRNSHAYVRLVTIAHDEASARAQCEAWMRAKHGESYVSVVSPYAGQLVPAGDCDDLVQRLEREADAWSTQAGGEGSLAALLSEAAAAIRRRGRVQP